MAAPTITLNYPATNNWTTDTTPDFNFNVSGADATYNCVLYVNDTVKGTNSSVLNNTATTITASTIAEGLNYQWKIGCTGTVEGSANSSARTINIDATAPTVIVTIDKTQTEYSKSITVTCGASDNLNTSLTSYTITITKPSGSTASSTRTSNGSVQFTGSQLNEKGSYTATCTVVDWYNSGSDSETFRVVAGDDEQVIVKEQETKSKVSNTGIFFIILLAVVIIATIIVLASSGKKRR